MVSFWVNPTYHLRISRYLAFQMNDISSGLWCNIIDEHSEIKYFCLKDLSIIMP